MALGNLELLSDVDITFSEGRKYGLVGKNGIGKVKWRNNLHLTHKKNFFFKTTFLKHLASHAFNGIPKHLQILHIEQEIIGNSTTVLDAVLKTDIERTSLLKEADLLQLENKVLKKLLDKQVSQKKLREQQMQQQPPNQKLNFDGIKNWKKKNQISLNGIIFHRIWNYRGVIIIIL